MSSQAKRVQTRPSRAAKAKRVDAKKQRGSRVKQGARGRSTGLATECTTSGSRRPTRPSSGAQLDRGRRRADRRRARRDRQHGQCRGLALGGAARPQLGRLLPQCRRRAGARAVPGPAGLHPHPVRQGRLRRRRRRRSSRSASTTSTPFPAISPATPPRAPSWSCRSSHDGALLGVLDLDSPSPARFDAEDVEACANWLRCSRRGSPSSAGRAPRR